MTEHTKTRIISHIFVWLNCWVAILESIICIVTLGFYNPYWSFKVVCWESKWHIKRRLKAKEKDKK